MCIVQNAIFILHHECVGVNMSLSSIYIFFFYFKDYNRQISQYHKNTWYYELKCDKHI